MSQQNPKSLLPPLILVATHFELQSIKSGLGNCGISADFECIGVGPGAVWRWAESKRSTKANDSPTGRTVILAGLAGALDPTFTVATVRSAEMIVGAGADYCRPNPSYSPPLRSHHTTVIASVDKTCADAATKKLLRDQTGAGMVDMESAAFASLATQRRWKWGVFRAVSDDSATDIPPWIASLVRVDGSINVIALATALLTHPTRIAKLAAIGASARHALRELCLELAVILSKYDQPQRTLIFGGTFDPPHRRHAQMVAEAANFLGCNRVIILPAGQSPLREGNAAASAQQRLAMATLAFSKVPGVVIDSREMNRSGESFTVDTLREIARESGASRNDLVLLIGADQALQFDRWKEWREIDHKLATIAIVPRPPLAARDLSAQLDEKFSRLGEDGERWEKSVLPFEAVDLSATEIRSRLRSGQNIGDLVSPEVEAWIRQYGLYA